MPASNPPPSLTLSHSLSLPLSISLSLPPSLTLSPLSLPLSPIRRLSSGDVERSTASMGPGLPLAVFRNGH